MFGVSDVWVRDVWVSDVRPAERTATLPVHLDVSR
jgi:hypothetical protein